MKIYLAGPMRGKPQFNFPEFKRYAAFLRSLGHEVFSPAERDEAQFGPEFATKNMTGDETLACQKGFTLREALGADLAWICKEAEAIAMMPGHSLSKGARAERATAEALGLKVAVLPKRLPTKLAKALTALSR